MDTDPYKHFPLSSGYHERSEPLGELGERFEVYCLPMGQIDIPSGRLAIGDPLLGMSQSNPWIEVAPGAYTIVQTRLLCLDRNRLDIPAYLSLILDPEAIAARRKKQVEVERDGGDPWLGIEDFSILVLDDEGRWQQQDHIEHEEEAISLPSQSGVVAMVDERAFAQRMPNPLNLTGGWYEHFFDPYAAHSWVGRLDDAEHLGPGAANIPLPAGPDDWEDNKPPTIALAQKVEPGDCIVFFEHAHQNHNRISVPIALHIELGVMLATQTHDPSSLV